MENNIWENRITVNPNQCGGRPCIRGMRIRVVDILDLLASGMNQPQIIEELPDLEKEDIEAALRYFNSNQIMKIAKEPVSTAFRGQTGSFAEGPFHNISTVIAV